MALLKWLIMRNTLKFLLLSTLLCTMSLLSSNGYSVEYNDYSDSTSVNHLQETDEQLIAKVENVLRHKIKKDRKTGNIYSFHYGTEITKAEMDRYNKLMKERNSGDEANTSDESHENAEETDEELVTRINKILNIDPRNPLGMINPNRTVYDKDGNTIVHTKYGLDEYIITKAEMDRYNKLMKERKSEDKANTSAESDKKKADPFFIDGDGQITLVQKKSPKANVSRNNESDEEFIKMVGPQFLHDEKYGSVIMLNPKKYYEEYDKFVRLIKEKGQDEIYKILKNSVDDDLLEYLPKLEYDYAFE